MLPRSAALLVTVLVLLGCEKKTDGLVTSTSDAAEGLVVATATSRPPRADRDVSCAQDDECVPAPGCCPAPCTSDVVNRRALPALQDSLSKTCSPQRACPSVGACSTHAYLCVSGRCKLVYEGAPEYRARSAAD
ncbi:MAG: hypothetical protein KF764_03465 [Labilithrix sp.]|nr:hypothetical protein [Labilithrix sp.]MBX3221099.1 hypothetical protein [Labilithrix sp.]